MNDELSSAIDILTAKVRTKEEDLNRLKKTVNELCAEAGLDIRYPGISDGAAAQSEILGDAYYGQTLTAAIRNYLERRKASGLSTATVQEIHKAIKEGGYKFDTENELNQKISVGNAIRKTSSIFHRLPNGQFGLLSWYPGAKAKPENEVASKPESIKPIGSAKKKKKKKGKKAKKEQAIDPAPTSTPSGPATTPQPAIEKITNNDIRDVVLAQDGEFTGANIESAIKVKFPSKELPKTKIPAVLYILKGKGLLTEVSKGAGKKGGVYRKA